MGGAGGQKRTRRMARSNKKRTRSPDGADPKVTEQSNVLRILQSFRRIIRAVDLDSRRLIAQYGITGPQLLCLTNVVEKRQMSVAALARTIHLSSSTVVGILDRLEQKGLILRSRDARDRRIVNIASTPPGQQLVAQAPSPLQQILTQALETLTKLEQATIALSLERIVDLIETCGMDTAPMFEADSVATDGGSASGTDQGERSYE